METITVYGHDSNTSIYMPIVLTENESEKLDEIQRSFFALQSENDVHGDGTKALYGSWDYPYSTMRPKALELEREVEERTGVIVCLL